MKNATTLVKGKANKHKHDLFPGAKKQAQKPLLHMSQEVVINPLMKSDVHYLHQGFFFSNT